jgi:hypothetical protein
MTDMHRKTFLLVQLSSAPYNFSKAHKIVIGILNPSLAARIHRTKMESRIPCSFSNTSPKLHFPSNITHWSSICPGAQQNSPIFAPVMILEKRISTWILQLIAHRERSGTAGPVPGEPGHL